MTPDPKPKTWRSEEYKAFIRSKPCCGPGCYKPAPSDPHHESITGRGMGIKASDLETLPLCRRCHTARENIGFMSFWGSELLPPMLMLRYINEWLNRKEDAM